MSKLKKIFVFLFLLGVTLPIYGEINQKKLQELREKKYHCFENYFWDATQPLEKRFITPPKFLLEAMKELDEHYDYAAYPLSESDKKEITKCLSLLPSKMKVVMSQNLLGIYFVHNLWGGGFTDYVLDEKGKVYTIMLLNPSCLNFNLSEWMTAKENSAFILDDETYQVIVKTSTDVSGLFYLLSHEGTHVMDYAQSLSPWTEKDLQILKNIKYQPTEFTKGVWADEKLGEKTYTFSDLTNISIYGFRGKPRLRISQMNHFYTKLEKTPWPSMYATFYWAEDLAELTAFSIITKNLNTEISYQVSRQNQILGNYKPLAFELVHPRLKSLSFLK